MRFEKIIMGALYAVALAVAAVVLQPLFVSPPAVAQEVSFPGASVYCGVPRIDRVHGDEVGMTYISACFDPNAYGWTLPFTSGGTYPSSVVIDTGGRFSRCAFGAVVKDLRWAQANGAYDSNLPADATNPEYLACDPNVAPTVLFSVYSGPDGALWNKVTDVGAICNAIVDPNGATSQFCARQEFTERTYARYVRLGWAMTSDPNVAGHDPNCAFNQANGDAWFSCTR